MADPKPTTDQRLRVIPDNLDAIFKTPMLAVPIPLRPVVAEVWMLHRHLAGMESPLALAAAISVWIDRWGLTQDDLKAVLVGMTHPGQMGNVKFASDLMSNFAHLCARKIETKGTSEADIRRLI